VTIAENMTHRQFVGFVEAETKDEALKKANEEFVSEKPLYSAHFKIIMCHKIQSYKSKGGD
jgi:hypothetical protein